MRPGLNEIRLAAKGKYRTSMRESINVTLFVL